MRTIRYQDILAAKDKGPRAVHEASLGRVFQHMKKSGERSLGILSAYRKEFRKDPKVNPQRDKNLQADLRSLGYGFFRLIGYWKECQDDKIPYAKCPEEKKELVREPSLFVPGMTLQVLVDLVRRYNQDAGVYLGPETGGQAWLVFPDGSTAALGSFTPSKVSDIYSRVKGRPFVFEWVPQGEQEQLEYEQWLRASGKLTHEDVFLMEQRRLMLGLHLQAPTRALRL